MIFWTNSTSEAEWKVENFLICPTCDWKLGLKLKFTLYQQISGRYINRQDNTIEMHIVACGHSFCSIYHVHVIILFEKNIVKICFIYTCILYKHLKLNAFCEIMVSNFEEIKLCSKRTLITKMPSVLHIVKVNYLHELSAHFWSHCRCNTIKYKPIHVSVDYCTLAYHT